METSWQNVWGGGGLRFMISRFHIEGCEHQYRPHRSVDSAISTTISTDSKFRAHRNLLIVESQSVVIAVSFKGRTEALIDYQNCPQSALIYQLTMGAPGHLYCIDSIELTMKLGAG